MTRRVICFLLCAAWMTAAPRSAAAHVTSTSFLTIDVGAQELQLDWEIAVRDIEYVFRLDRARYPPEVPVPLSTLAEYARARLFLRADGADLPLATRDMSMSMRDGVPHGIFSLAAPLPPQPRLLELDYRLFVVDEDPNHRALFSVAAGNLTHAGVLERSRNLRRLRLRDPSLRDTFADFLHQGVWHIWLGFDHVTFLLALLLPAVLVRREGAWSIAHERRPVFVEVLRVVTAFTVAHSITLVLATLEVVRAPGSLVEPAIAASVLWAALANLRPSAWGHGWPAAFAFGLLHGFGFAGALQELELPSRHLGWALLAFNAGVELGQLAIVGVFVPLAFALRVRPWYQTRVLRYGSLGIALLAAVWLGERVAAP